MTNHIKLDSKDRSAVETAYRALLEARAHRDQLVEQKMALEQRINTESTQRVNQAMETYRRAVSLVGYKHGVDEDTKGSWTLNSERTHLVPFDPQTMRIIEPTSVMKQVEEGDEEGFDLQLEE